MAINNDPIQKGNTVADTKLGGAKTSTPGAFQKRAR